jgi:hypothetical protein
VFFGYALLTMDECTLFTHADSMNNDAREHMKSSGVAVLQYDQIWSHLKTWGQQLGEQRQTAGSRPESPKQQPVDGDEKKKNARPTYKASLSSKTSWAVAEALGKVSSTQPGPTGGQVLTYRIM